MIYIIMSAPDDARFEILGPGARSICDFRALKALMDELREALPDGACWRGDRAARPPEGFIVGINPKDWTGRE